MQKESKEEKIRRFKERGANMTSQINYADTNDTGAEYGLYGENDSTNRYIPPLLTRSRDKLCPVSPYK